MPRPLPIALVQAPPRPAGGVLADYAGEVETVLRRFPETRLAAFPELHLCGVDGEGDERTEQLRAAAEPLHGSRTKQLGELAGDLGIWLAPGTVCEEGDHGELFNTALVFSPQGELAGWYRKVFPWRPHEPYDPGKEFVVADLADAGRVGFSICYDAWFPEVTRHLAWMGAEVVLNPVQTTTPDRAQELVLARANAIVNQVFVASVNTAGPFGMGDSLLVGPEGDVLGALPGPGEGVLAHTIDLDEVARVRRDGTAGTNRMWEQFTPADAPLPLPLYQGRIDPDRWRPREGDDR
ncbi:carbon-nitrogen hydrolase family protein [Amycolatopsis sp., V23-08]|uniref:Carbon-nitrogen hydrolase family protein n=1 Tax=Amycolatopsis heterodermiae TaxID=3110235 RepID=A0ABU5RPC3_9PSEU|nr:carbon-nitrogen hydrolase family protein [Amycolatopsis sp., V23-08]MEA5367480.1 carbon-nitrogen hydrolase family protein [Amycolatopsis sp., V23-08]